eukprot:CAMPEP_0198354874 /NCGR_PEP_ID=MMETSP1450-20131203/116910_1 /TAXON_ID=753684 ORGANISM="Madagascaria erythrocladiodes, Strain CCMP3234" /NCGR_SAMPLE_ID=MMETSP1450 /ASSEMBLY_ACC=CAM_ASM_001115 /LENGTH=175 /DNA_ID=CAMNT_0044061191 /DNA_START=74 /DNA_END=598 /DNA_ORIENTATION=-
MAEQPACAGGAAPRLAVRVVFLLGRPGSGKSEFYNVARRVLHERHGGLRCVRFDDVRRLREMAAGEHDGHRYLIPDPRTGGFAVRDFSVFTLVLRHLASEVQRALAERDDSVVLVEFARADNVDMLLAAFPRPMLDKALIVYLHVTLARSIDRTRRRVDEQARTVSMDHAVSADV